MPRPNYTPDLINRVQRIESDLYELKRRQAGMGGKASGDDFWITTGKILMTGSGHAVATVTFGLTYPVEPVLSTAVIGIESDLNGGAAGLITLTSWTVSGGYVGAEFFVSRTGGSAGTQWQFVYTVEEFA